MNPPPAALMRTPPLTGTVPGWHQAAAAPTPVPLPPSVAAAAPVAGPDTARSESDVRWIVGWVRDLLVIAMAVANLLHIDGSGH